MVCVYFRSFRATPIALTAIGKLGAESERMRAAPLTAAARIGAAELKHRHPAGDLADRDRAPHRLRFLTCSGYVCISYDSDLRGRDTHRPRIINIGAGRPADGRGSANPRGE